MTNVSIAVTEPEEVPSSSAPPLLRPPLQARSRRTLQKILSEGIRVLKSDGPEGLTVGAITRGAKISVGSFYARFPGKDDLLRFLGEEALTEALEVWTNGGKERSEAPRAGRAGTAGVADNDGEVGRGPSQMESALDTLVGLYLEGPGLTLALLEGVQDSSPSRRRQLEMAVTDQLSALTGVDPQRTGVRVRALVGLLQDAARRTVLGQAGQVEYGFLPEGEVLREEGLALLIGRPSEARPEVWRKVQRARVQLATTKLDPLAEEVAELLREADKVVEMPGEVEIPPPQSLAAVEAIPEPDEPDSFPLPSPQTDSNTPEPDPFDVWG